MPFLLTPPRSRAPAPGRISPVLVELRQRLLTWLLDTADAVPRDLDAVEWTGLFGPTSTAV